MGVHIVSRSVLTEDEQNALLPPILALLRESTSRCPTVSYNKRSGACANCTVSNKASLKELVHDRPLYDNQLSSARIRLQQSQPGIARYRKAYYSTGGSLHEEIVSCKPLVLRLPLTQA